jgi:HPt (histidine-containing phosphotransfer) domain-containing protein
VVNETVGSPLAEAMNRLWTKFLPQMAERVTTLQKAAESAARGTLGEAEQQTASSDAHKLAGVLGTFGLQEGTDLAREAESLYAGTLDGSAAISARLTQIAEQLRTIIASRR